MQRERYTPHTHRTLCGQIGANTGARVQLARGSIRASEIKREQLRDQRVHAACVCVCFARCARAQFVKNVGFGVCRCQSVVVGVVT